MFYWDFRYSAYHYQIVLSSLRFAYIVKNHASQLFSFHSCDKGVWLLRIFQKHPLLTGTFLLMAAGLISRAIGFFYRIFLSHSIGAEGLGIYQLIFPVYSMCFSLCASGIQSAISRYCASAFANRQREQAKKYFQAGFFLSFSISVLLFLFVFLNTDWICLHILKETRCAGLLRVISIGIPLGTIHICVSAWYFSQGTSVIPSISQLLEQVSRVAASYFIFRYMMSRGITVTPLIAVLGIVAGECVSSVFCVLSILKQYCKQTSSSLPIPGAIAANHHLQYIKEIFKMSVPLTSNRVMLTLLQSAEAILIPVHLQKSGLTRAAALSSFGSFSGMALPCILFPTAITSAVSTMLMPNVARQQAQNRISDIRRSIERCLKYCLLLGILCGGIFFTFGEMIGNIVFGNAQAGLYLQILSLLCPFLYMTSTLTSILNGMGHTGLSFLQNAAGLVIRICFVLFAVPVYGITAYLWGIMVSQIFIVVLNLCFLYHYVPFRVHIYYWFFLPLFVQIVSCAIAALCIRSVSALFYPPLAILTGILICSAVSAAGWFMTGIFQQV